MDFGVGLVENFKKPSSLSKKCSAIGREYLGDSWDTTSWRQSGRQVENIWETTWKTKMGDRMGDTVRDKFENGNTVEAQTAGGKVGDKWETRWKTKLETQWGTRQTQWET